MPALRELAKCKLALNDDAGIAEVWRRLVNLPADDNAAMLLALSVFEEPGRKVNRAPIVGYANPEDSRLKAKAWRVVTEYRTQVTKQAFQSLSNELNAAGEDPIPASREAMRREALEAQGAEMHRLHAKWLVERNVNLPEAIEVAQRAIERDPANYREMEFLTAIAKARTGDVEEADRLMKDRVLIDRNPGYGIIDHLFVPLVPASRQCL